MAPADTRPLLADRWPEIASGELENLTKELGVTNPELFHVEVQFVAADTIRALNKQYRNKDEATDVLSFPLYSYKELEEIKRQKEKGKIANQEAKLGEETILMGSLVVCKEIVAERDHGISWTLLHGLRHLFGYDHDEAGERWTPSDK